MRTKSLILFLTLVAFIAYAGVAHGDDYELHYPDGRVRHVYDPEALTAALIEFAEGTTDGSLVVKGMGHGGPATFARAGNR